MNKFILLLLPLSILGQELIHAPYQVGIYLFDNYNPSFGAKNFPLCSAAIIHPLFAVTTADCVHAHIAVHNIVQPFSPKSMYIKSGNFSETRENIKYVKEIHIHPKFNSSTMENDIAVIQVELAFQFIHPYNERWVQLPDTFINYKKCIFSTNKANTGPNDLYPYSEIKTTTVLNNTVCLGNNTNYLTEIDNITLCSIYDFDHPFMCQVPESQLRLNRDRGTPLICDNKLAGLLSVIIPTNITNSTESCSKTLKTNAYYTRLTLYVKWIHSIIGVNSPDHSPDSKPIPLIPISKPYGNDLSVVKPVSMSTAAAINSPRFIEMILITFITWLLIHKFSTI